MILKIKTIFLDMKIKKRIGWKWIVKVRVRVRVVKVRVTKYIIHKFEIYFRLFYM